MQTISREEKINKLLELGFYKKEELLLLEDSMLNDLYLKYLIETKQLSLDDCEKPWVINYPWRPTKFIDLNKSLYDTYVDANLDNQKGVAMYDYNSGRVMLNDELKELADAFAVALVEEYGLGVDSKIGAVANAAIEEPMALLSPNAIGSRVKFLDYFKGPFDMQADIEKSKIDILLIDEAFIDWEPLMNNNNLPVIVLNATRDYSNTNYKTFDQVVALGASKISEVLEKYRNDLNFSPSDPTIEIKSSGTTGHPKSIVHSSMTINSAAQKMFFTGHPYGRGNFVLKSIPSQLGLGSVTTLYSGLVSGTGIILIHPASKDIAFDLNAKVIQDFPSLKRKFEISDESILMNFASPMFFRGINERIDGIDNMSYLGGLLAAGSKMTEEELIDLNKSYSDKGCTVPINNAYGQNEQAGAVTVNTPNHDEPGSAGYPVIGTDVKIIDIETGKELPVGTEGRIVERSSSQFLYYDGLEEESKAAIITLPDGSKWFDTRDRGYFSPSGFLYVTGRESRVITNSDFKLSLDVIQEKIAKLGIFQEVATVPFHKGPDEFPALFAQLNEESNDLSIEDVIEKLKMNLGEYEFPAKTILLDKIPSLPSGKIDYQSLELIVNQLSGINNGKINYSDLAREARLLNNQVAPGQKLELNPKK